MSRISAQSRDDLTDESRVVYDEIMATRGEVDRPFQILLPTPELLRRVAHLGLLMRFDSSVPPAIRECLILATARELECEFEWTGHEPTARESGVSERTIQSIRDGRTPSDADEGAQAVVCFVYESLRDHAVCDETFGRVQTAFGVRGTTEIAATLGYYTMLATLINAFESHQTRPPLSGALR